MHHLLWIKPMLICGIVSKYPFDDCIFRFSGLNITLCTNVTILPYRSVLKINGCVCVCVCGARARACVCVCMCVCIYVHSPWRLHQCVFCKFRNRFYYQLKSIFSQFLYLFVETLIHYKTGLKHTVTMLSDQGYCVTCIYSCKVLFLNIDRILGSVGPNKTLYPARKT